MKTNTQPQNNIPVNSQIQGMAQGRLSQIDAAITGRIRLRNQRWHASTSIRDCHRIADFVESLGFNGKLNKSMYNRLNNEVSSFQTVLGTNLSKKLRQVVS